MANVLDTVFSWNGKYAQRGELSAKTFVEKMLPLSTFERLGIEVFTNIQSVEHFGRTQVIDGFLRKKAANCATTAQDIGSSISDLPLSVTELEFFAKQCGDVVKQTVYELGRKKGVEIDDLTDTEISDILLRMITPGIARDLQRVMYFGDTASTNDAFDLMDGYFKILTAAGSGVPNTPIANNFFATAGNGIKIFRDVFDTASTFLKSYNDDVVGDNSRLIYTCTGSAYDALYNDMTNPAANTSTYQGFVVQPTGITFRGIPIVPMRIWDYTVATYFATAGAGSTPLKPHKVILTTRDNFMFGTDAEADITRLDMWYQRNERQTYFEAQMVGGVQVRDLNLVSAAGL